MTLFGATKPLSLAAGLRKMKKSGCVYILANMYMPGLVKIGATTKSPYFRADQLSSATGVPGAFDVIAFLRCDDCMVMEAVVHAYIHEHRVELNREFFDIPVFDAVEILGEFGHVEHGSREARENWR